MEVLRSIFENEITIVARVLLKVFHLRLVARSGGGTVVPNSKENIYG